MSNNDNEKLSEREEYYQKMLVEFKDLLKHDIKGIFYPGVTPDEQDFKWMMDAVDGRVDALNRCIGWMSIPPTKGTGDSSNAAE